MGQAGTQYRELAFSIGCPIKTKGEQALNKSQQYAADGRRTPFPWLLRRHSKVAAVLSVTPHEYNRVRRLLFNSGISDLFADRTGAFFAAKAIVWGQTDLSNG